MRLTVGDLDKTVTLRDVEGVLREYNKSGAGEHRIDIGDLGYHYVDCDQLEIDITEILEKLA